MTARLVIRTAAGQLSTPHDCYEQLKTHFESDDWRARHQDKKIREFEFFWAAPGTIIRPQTEETFETLTGIRTRYQFLVLRNSVVAARQSSCWCAACFDATGPNDAGPMDSMLRVASCAHASCSDASLHAWEVCSVVAMTSSAVSRRRTRSQNEGHRLAIGLTPNQWVLVQVTSCRVFVFSHTKTFREDFDPCSTSKFKKIGPARSRQHASPRTHRAASRRGRGLRRGVVVSVLQSRPR